MFPAPLARNADGIECRFSRSIASARNMGSRSGSMSCLTTICATRSATVGTPKILSPPDFLEMETARRRWKVASRAHSIPELVEIVPQVGFELLDRLPIHACRARIGFDRFVSLIHPLLIDTERLVCRTHRRPPVASCFDRTTT